MVCLQGDVSKTLQQAVYYELLHLLDLDLADISCILYRTAWSVVRKMMRPTYFAEFNLDSTFSTKHETLWHWHGGFSVEVNIWNTTDLFVFWSPPLILQQPSWGRKAAMQLSALFPSLSVDPKHQNMEPLDFLCILFWQSFTMAPSSPVCVPG